MGIKKPGTILREIVEQMRPELLVISDLESKVKRGDKWSKREIMGHLIDSAAINHNRFVEAQLKDDLVFGPYDQDQWVALQRYQDVSWKELINLWSALNLHLAFVVSKISREKMSQRTEIHNFEQVAWKAVAPGKPTSLKYFVWDYIAHMEHHLRSVRPSYKPIVINNY